jgi:erythritol transport system substrate-binding protein
MIRGGARILVLALSALAGLSACRREDSSKRLIVIMVPSQDNPFFKAEADAAAARARALGYRVRVDAHDDDAFRQDNLIDAAIASNAAAIILDNAGADSSIAAVRRATKAGIACFLIDREINTTGVAKAQILADNRQGSAIVAQSFVDAIGPAGGEYVELLGKESDTNAQVRTTGFHSVIDQQHNLVRVAAQSANWSQSEAFQKTETMLQAHPNVRGIIAGNDTMALGALAAVKSEGRKGIVITGLDGSPDAIAQIRAGAMRATSLQPAVEIARLAVDEADRFLKTGATGKPEMQIIPCILVTQSNANDFSDFEKVR